MMLQLGDDGVVTSVNEEELVYVDKNELEQLIENYQQLEKENEKLKDSLNFCKENVKRLHDDKKELINENEQLMKENQELRMSPRVDVNEIESLVCENERLKQYKQSVIDVLLSWSQKNLTAKQLQVVIAIMKELNIYSGVDVE